MFKTKEFWTAALGLIVSLVSYFGAKYLAPSIFEDVQFVVKLIEPFILLLIGYEFYKGGFQDTVMPYLKNIKR